jgi:hypothetical protein
MSRVFVVGTTPGELDNLTQILVDMNWLSKMPARVLLTGHPLVIEHSFLGVRDAVIVRSATASNFRVPHRYYRDSFVYITLER